MGTGMSTLIDEFNDIGLCPECGAYWACECGAWRPGSRELTVADIHAAIRKQAEAFEAAKATRRDWLNLMERTADA